MDVKKSNKVVSDGDANKPRRQRLRVGDPDFVPPDGGWGWMVLVATGFSNLSTFPMFQQFGLLFQEKFLALGISNAQTTTVINMNSAFNACVGLANGPVFRRFSYRQVALFGATLVACSLFFTVFCNEFWSYLLIYSICYGSGIGITQSSNSLALNTYFKERRRIATGLSWSVTALGPIVWPHIITALKDVYGMDGTLLIFAAFAGHAIMGSLLLQPVHWHTKYREEQEAVELGSEKPLIEVTDTEESGYFEGKTKSRSIFSSQYLYNEDDPKFTGYEITDPGTPRMVSANDGWYSNKSLVGSRLSLYSNKTNKDSKKTSNQNSLTVSKRPSYVNLTDMRSKRNSSVNLSFEGKPKRKVSQTKPKIEESCQEDCPTEKAPHDLKENEKLLISQSPPEFKKLEKLLMPAINLESSDLKDGEKPLLSPQTLESPIIYPNEKEVLKVAAIRLEEYKQHEEIKATEELAIKEMELELEKVQQNGTNGKGDDPPKNFTLMQKIIIFFDFDLLKDPIYVNLMLGITIANFAELNFSILTPFVLTEFNFGKYEISTFMSLLGATDIFCRFFIPFIAGKIGWENKTFFLVGVLGMALGRIILVHTQTYLVSLGVAVLIGFGKGLRTIFMALVIPTHVSLERLPAASGLQLVTSGLLFLVLGPVVGALISLISYCGWIRDWVKNYVITLHILNICTYITTVAWTIEHFVSKSRKNKAKKAEEAANKAKL